MIVNIIPDEVEKSSINKVLFEKYVSMIKVNLLGYSQK